MKKFLQSKLNYCNQEQNIMIKPGTHGRLRLSWPTVLQFFSKDRLIRVHGSLDKAYHDDVWLDHACPFTIRSSTRIPVHRVPNVVGVGLAKCGTGTLAFLGKFLVESNPYFTLNLSSAQSWSDKRVRIRVRVRRCVRGSDFIVVRVRVRTLVRVHPTLAQPKPYFTLMISNKEKSLTSKVYYFMDYFRLSPKNGFPVYRS